MQLIKFPGKLIKCPKCSSNIKFTWTSGMSTSLSTFYSKENNDVLRSSILDEKIRNLSQLNLSDFELEASIVNLLNFYGNNKYGVWSNVKCPHCNFEFPYNFAGNIRLRISDPAAVLIDGCIVSGGQEEESYIVIVE